MAIGPIDYYSQYAPNLGGSFIQGLSAGAQMRQAQANNALTQAQQLKQQAQEAWQKKLEAMLANKGATWEDWNKLSFSAPDPTTMNAVQNWAVLQKQGFDQEVAGTTGQALQSVLNGQRQRALEMAKARREAAEQSGNPLLIETYKGMEDLLASDATDQEVTANIQTILASGKAGATILPRIKSAPVAQAEQQKTVAQGAAAESEASIKAQEEAATAERLRQEQEKRAAEIAKLDQQKEKERFLTEEANWRKQNEEMIATINKETLQAQVEMKNAQNEEQKAAAQAKLQELETKKGERQQQYSIKQQMTTRFNDDIDWLLAKENRDDVLRVIGVSGNIPVVPGTKAYDAKLRLERVKNTQTSDNLKLISGVISDSDLKFLAAMSSGFEGGSENMVLTSLRDLQKLKNDRIKRLENAYRDVKAKEQSSSSPSAPREVDY